MKLKLRRALSCLLLLALLSAWLPASAHGAGYDSGYEGGMAGDGLGIYAHGVDLSSWQGEAVDFEALKADGYSFVILRAGFATTRDRTFEGNYERAKAAGLDVGVYLYSYAETVEEVLQEAAALKSWLEGKTLEYPVYYDLEDPEEHEWQSVEALSALATAFMDSMAADGWLVGLYSCLSWLQYKIDTENVCARYECWMAQYLYTGTYEIYDRYDEVYGMWQYSSSGTVAGVPGPADLNICFKDYPAICREYGFNGYSPQGASLVLKQESLPQTLRMGKVLHLEGTVVSYEGDLENVSIRLNTQEGEQVAQVSANPDGNRLDIRTLAATLPVQNLEEGDYVLRILAANSVESRLLSETSLVIGAAGARLDGSTIPQELTQGQSCFLEGIVSAGTAIDAVLFELQDDRGAVIRTANATPRAQSFDLARLAVSLDDLVAGKYHINLTVVCDGVMQHLMNQPLRIWLAAAPIRLDDFSLQGGYAPGELTALSGTVTSSLSNLEEVRVSILNRNGEVVTTSQVSGAGTRVGLTGMSSRMGLADLPLGAYVCVIEALNGAGRVTLAEACFLIRRDVVSLCNFSAPAAMLCRESETLRGVLATEREPLQMVTVTVADEAGNLLLHQGAIPKEKVFDLETLDLRFADLQPGSYRLTLRIRNADGIQTLYDVPLEVLQKNDTVVLSDPSFAPEGASLRVGESIRLTGRVTSGISPLEMVSARILTQDGVLMSEALLSPEEQVAGLQEMNQNLRVSALPVGAYRLVITATNGSGTYTLMDSPFEVTTCRHENVLSGTVYDATCTHIGVVTDSCCLDCGGKVRTGIVTGPVSHRYREGFCTVCGQTEASSVGLQPCSTSPRAYGHYVLAACVDGRYFALGSDLQPVEFTPQSGEVSANLLWSTAVRSDGKLRGLTLVNSRGQTLHFDAGGLRLAGGSSNALVCFEETENGWRLTGGRGGLCFKEGAFVLGDATDLVLYEYVP